MAPRANATTTMTLLRQVALRMRLGRLGAWTYRGLLAAAAIYAVLLLVSRLTGLIPDRFEPWTLALVPAVALVVGLLLHRGPTVREAAERADAATRSKDLFLTAASLEGTPGGGGPGEYQPLVVRDAEAKAGETSPAAVVPFSPWNRLGHAAVAMLVIAGLLFVPQLDPFGEREQEELLAAKREQLKREQELTIRRAVQLQKAAPEAPHSAPVEQKLEELMKTFREMKEQEQAGNLRKLAEQRQLLEDQWRKKSEEQLKQSLSQGSMAQRFGGATGQSRQMKDQLQQGNPEPAKEKLQDLQEKIQELQKTEDPVEKQKLQQQIKQGMQEMASLAQETGGAGLAEAINRAMEQLDTASMEGLTQESMQALSQSLSLSQQELEALAQSARDLQSLQQAMQALQTAMALNQIQPLDGSQAGNCNSLGQYAQLYQQMLSQCQGGGGSPLGIPNLLNPGGGRGGGMGGPGQGRGNVAPEDPTQQMATKTEKSQSAVQAGKILMQFKTKEVGEKGEVVKDYRQALAEVKQGASEAILQEQVPPGYHDAIREYFDHLEPADAAAGPEGASGGVPGGGGGDAN